MEKPSLSNGALHSVLQRFPNVFLTGFHFDGLDIGKHVQPEEGHDPDEADSQPGRHKHEVHKLSKNKLLKLLTNNYSSSGEMEIVLTCTGSQKMQSRRKVVTPFC